jgi:hypothetical protein
VFSVWQAGPNEKPRQGGPVAITLNDAARRFPPPRTVEGYRDIAYIIRDANNFAVAYVYHKSEPGRRAAPHLMTKDEARKIAGRQPANDRPAGCDAQAVGKSRLRA